MTNATNARPAATLSAATRDWHARYNIARAYAALKTAAR